MSLLTLPKDLLRCLLLRCQAAPIFTFTRVSTVFSNIILQDKYQAMTRQRLRYVTHSSYTQTNSLLLIYIHEYISNVPSGQRGIDVTGTMISTNSIITLMVSSKDCNLNGIPQVSCIGRTTIRMVNCVVFPSYMISMVFSLATVL